MSQILYKRNPVSREKRPFVCIDFAAHCEISHNFWGVSQMLYKRNPVSREKRHFVCIDFGNTDEHFFRCVSCCPFAVVFLYRVVERHSHTRLKCARCMQTARVEAFARAVSMCSVDLKSGQ